MDNQQVMDERERPTTVWRRIKSLGAIYLQNSAAARPPSVPRGSCGGRSWTCGARRSSNEVDLGKLRNWLAKVADRDVFGAHGRPNAEKAVEECEQSLEAYAARVFAEEAEGH
jgi:hypothetical protein